MLLLLIYGRFATMTVHPLDISTPILVILPRDVTKFEFEFEHWRISNNFTAFRKCKQTRQPT